MTPVPGISTTTDSMIVFIDNPLEKFRKEASFCWRKMRQNIENPEQLEVKIRVWRMLEQNKLYQRPLSLMCEEEKRLTAKQLLELHHSGVFDDIHNQCYKKRTRYVMTVNEATNMYSPSLSVKYALGVSLTANALLSLGTERHKTFYDALWQGKILSCLALTELAHGSDLKRLRTTATFDPASQQFIIHTPDYLAAKCWVGNLGKQSTHALLFAQLWTRGMCQGLHGFFIPVRDPVTMQPYPGLTIGDIGEKAGVHGIDNGYILFNNYRVSRENLLNRIGDVTTDGEYETSFTDPQRILGAALENLSAGRVAIIQTSCNTLSCAVTIAIRYAAVRTQFCDADGVEVPLLSYQLHQWRLFKHLAAAYVLKVFVRDFTDQYLDCVVDSQNGSKDVQLLSSMVSGIHAVVSCSKPLITWATRDAIQEAREACGGNGFLKAAGISDLRNDHDPTVTYEGDNNVLLQQTSNWLLRQREVSVLPEELPDFPRSCTYYLTSTPLQTKYAGQNVCSNNFVEEVFNWLVCWLRSATEHKVNNLLTQMDRFKAKNSSQVFHAHTLSLVFAENTVLKYFWRHCICSERELQPVLEQLYFLYALSCLQKHTGNLYQGGYCHGPELPEAINTAILKLCSQLRPEAISLAEALAPPDFILNSVIARSDGNLYKNLTDCFMNQPNSTGRPSWWQEIRPRSKL